MPFPDVTGLKPGDVIEGHPLGTYVLGECGDGMAASEWRPANGGPGSGCASTARVPTMTRSGQAAATRKMRADRWPHGGN
jgi:hypothetical protein